MKKINNLLFLFCSISFIIFSCKKNDFQSDSIDKKSQIISFKDVKKFPNSIIEINGGKNSFKEGLNNNKQSSIDLLDDSAWANNTGHSLIISSDENTVLTPYARLIYPGSVLDASSIADLTYKPLGQFQNKVKPITVSVSAQSKFVSGVIQAPSLSTTRSFLSSVYSDAFSGKELSSFTFDMNQFSYYDELKLAFSANVKVGSIFSIDASGSRNRIKKKTGLVAKFIQRNFTLDMDLPESGQLLNNTVSPADLVPYSPVYVSSITYGRMGILKVESDYSYDSVKYAFNVAFKAGIVSGGASVEKFVQDIITNSIIQVYTVGGDGAEIATSINGYDAFRQYIISGGNYTAQTPGVPLYFTLSNVSDNSVFQTIFRVNLPNN